MDAALYHVIPANDTKGSVFGPTIFPRRRQGSNPGPLAQEANLSATSRKRGMLKSSLFAFNPSNALTELVLLTVYQPYSLFMCILLNTWLS